jgi:Flavin containing amine oxidoreductase
MEVVVVGAGLGGLYCARGLVRLPFVQSVEVLEARDGVGGRMRTKYSSDGRPLYEEGAWRIPETHQRLLRLCAELGLEMMEVPSEGPTSCKEWLGSASEPRNRQPSPLVQQTACSRGTLSSWDVAAVRLGVRGADLTEAETGYAGLGIMAAGTDAYGVEQSQKRTGATEPPQRYFVPTTGMTSICARLKEDLLCKKAQRRPCRVRLKTRVVDVRASSDDGRCGFLVLCEERTGANSFSRWSLWADVVIAAVPPSQISWWGGVSGRLAPILAALAPVPLLKVFSKAGPRFRAVLGLEHDAFHLKSNTLGQQIISNTYPGTDFVQLAYCAGQRAEALEHLRLCGDMMVPLCEELSATLGLEGDRERALRELLLREEYSVHFWSEAVHVWRPSFDLNVDLKSAQACLAPHAALPGLFLCGEAVSTLQGWGEGALQTATSVVDAIAGSSEEGARRKGRVACPWTRIPSSLFPGRVEGRQTVVYDGRLLDVGAWAKVHPGSEAAIRAHLGEDVTELWDALHPKYALSLIFALQVGWSL